MTPASVISSKSPVSAAAVMSPTVFVVDDDTTARESMESMIRSAGWRPETFASGYEFLASSQTPAPSCLVLEMGLQDLHGLDLQQRVTTDRIGMTIIFVTGSADVPMTVRAISASLQCWLRGSTSIAKAHYRPSASSAQSRWACAS